MKIRKINILMAFSLVAIITLAGCNKDDGPIPERVTTTEVPVVSTTIDPTGSPQITFTNQAAFAGKFKVELYFPGATPPTKVDIVIRKTNGTTINNNNVKLYKADVTTLPATYTITAAEIAALFGAITLNDNYDFGPDIYVGTRKFEAFPATGIGTGPGVSTMPFYREFARFSAK